MKRSGLFKGSNVSFDPKAIMALSYDWWVFVAVIGGNVVFNGYRYSNTTAKHQSKVRSLMRELGIRIDREVSIRDSLSAASSLKDLNLKVKHQAMQDAKEAERKRIKRNERARVRRAEMRARKDAEFKTNLDSITVVDIAAYRAAKAAK